MAYANFTDKFNCKWGRNAITERLIMHKILEGVNGAEFYKDMDSRFLWHIGLMTHTTNGIVITDYSVRFIITPVIATEKDPVVSFVISFSRSNSQYTGVSDIIYRSGVDEKTMDEDNARRQILTGISNFESLAKHDGYIKHDTIGFFTQKIPTDKHGQVNV